MYEYCEFKWRLWSFVLSCGFRGLNPYLNWFAIFYCIFNGVFLNHL